MWSAARSAKISMILCMPERVSGGDAKFQGFCDGWNKWEGQVTVAQMHEVLKSGSIDITERSLRTFLDKGVLPGRKVAEVARAMVSEEGSDPF